MKVMDVTVEDKDGSIEMVTPPRKKLKQARLSFQMLSSSDPSKAVSKKKRKLSSPSTTDLRNPKIVKVSKNHTVSRASESVPTIIDLDVEENEKSVEKEEKSISETGKNIPKMAETKVGTDEKSIDEEAKGVPTEEVTDKCAEAESNESKKSDKEDAKDGQMKTKKTVNYGTLTAFLEKAQSKEEKDDVQLVPMSDYESGNSKDSKNKPDDEDSSKVSGETSDENNEEEEDDTVIETDVKSDCVKASLESKTEKPDAKSKSCEADSDACNRKKSSVTSDDNLDSDSDTSSDEDADDEPDKSSNETESKEKINDENNADGTPKSKKSAMKNRKLTPKQIQRKMESAKKREERQRLKMERVKKREEERKNRIKEKEERRREKEEKEKLEKEQRRKEKELKEQKKQMEIEQKQKEKEAKEEDRRKREEAKEEEKKRKEEERQEAERKKQKAASNFASFFVPKKQGSKASEEESDSDVKNFMPFEVKVDMRVAPITRRNMVDSEKSRFDELFNTGDTKENELYLQALKERILKPGKSGKTWPAEAKDDVVVIDEDDDSSSDLVDQGNIAREKYRAKLLMFKENRRPPFWGTWRKMSDRVNSRRPFAKDPKWFDYEVDSDDEWEEEEPGESLRGSDDERDEENPEDNEYDVDNEFMVPHGYLSDEEARADEEDGEDMSPETQKAKLKLLGEQFEAERNTKTARIKPRVIGCIWQGLDNSYADGTAPHIKQFLMLREAWVKETPIALTKPSAPASPHSWDCNSPTKQTVPKQTPGSKKKKVPAEAMPDLIRLLHGNTHGRIFLMKEFMTFWEKNKTIDKQISKLSLSQKIREIATWMACPDQGPMHLKSCWYVAEDVRKEFSCLEVVLPNRWEYNLTPKRKSEVEGDRAEREEKEKEKKRVPLITQFTKRISQEEMQKQLTAKSGTKTTTPQEKTGKRVALISVGRGEQFPKLSRNNLLTKFIGCGEEKNVKKVEEVVIVEDDSDKRSESNEKREDGTEKEDSAEREKDSTEKIENITEGMEDVTQKEESSAEKKEDSAEKKEDSTVKIEESGDEKEHSTEKKENSEEKNEHCEEEKDSAREKENSTENKVKSGAARRKGGKLLKSAGKTDEPKKKFIPEPMDTSEDCIILD